MSVSGQCAPGTQTIAPWKPAARLDDRLAEDNAKGMIADPAGAKVIEFPGRDRFQMPAFGPIQQAGTFQGVPIKIGGENDPVPVHLEDGKDKAHHPRETELSEAARTPIFLPASCG